MDSSDTRPQYPIRTVARRTGLSPHVLRAWERRYGVVAPSRSGGGVRLYSNADVFRLRLLQRVTAAGHAIGQVAHLSAEELLALLREEEREAPGAPPSPAQPPGRAERYVVSCLQAVEGMDGAGVHAALMRAVVELSSRQFTEEVALPLLHRVGELWSEGEICPAHEHLFSAQLYRVLAWLADALPVADGAPDAVAVTPAGQRHEFGALLAAIAAMEEGWRVTYLGPDLPAEDIATAAVVRRARAVLLSAAMDGESSLPSEVRVLRSLVHDDVRLLVGGRGAGPRREEVERAGATWLPDLAALRAELRTLREVAG